MGNDDIILPPGIVCDACNQYFGTKVEQEILSTAPFGIERVAQAIRNKKGNYPTIETKSLSLKSSGFWDRFYLQSNPPHEHFLPLPNRGLALNPKWSHPDLIARFLLKMGLGLLATKDRMKVFETVFDNARRCARFGYMANKWDFSLGIYPRREDLTIYRYCDDIGPLEARQIFQYSLGIMESGDVVFNFVFATSVFAINLSRPYNTEYLLRFNSRNKFTLESRWDCFHQVNLDNATSKLRVLNHV